jgi:hypothetical protein
MHIRHLVFKDLNDSEYWADLLKETRKSLPETFSFLKMRVEAFYSGINGKYRYVFLEQHAHQPVSMSLNDAPDDSRTKRNN